MIAATLVALAMAAQVEWPNGQITTLYSMTFGTKSGLTVTVQAVPVYYSYDAVRTVEVNGIHRPMQLFSYTGQSLKIEADGVFKSGF